MTNPEQSTPHNVSPDTADTPECELPPADRPRVYVASLADYNAGRLHGEWLDATETVEQLKCKIQAMLAQSTESVAEEYAIHDYENFGSIRLGEHESIEHIQRIARGIAEHGPAFAAWVSVTDHEDMWDSFADSYQGRFDSLTDYAESLAGQLGYLDALDRAIPDYLKPFVQFDAEQFGRDLYFGSSVAAMDSSDGGVWIFDSTL